MFHITKYRKFMKRYILFGITLLMAFPLSVLAQDDETEDDEVMVKPKRTITIKKYETRTVTGKVINATTQQPLAGVMVRAAEIDGYSVLTEDDGTYSLKLPVFATAIYVSSPDFNPVQVGLLTGTAQKVVSLYPTSFTPEYQQKTNVRGDRSANDFQYTNAFNIKDEVQ